MSRPADRRSSETLAAIHLCGTCESELVQPVAWQQLASSYWQIELRCPECEWHGAGVFGAEEIDAYEERYERGVDALVADLAALAEANLGDEVERFAAALHADLILPEDF